MACQDSMVEVPSILVGPPEAIPFLDRFKCQDLAQEHPAERPSTSTTPPPTSTSPFLQMLTGNSEMCTVNFYTPPSRGCTQNGAVTNLSSGSACLDFFFRVKQLCKPHEVRTHLQRAWAEDPSLAMKLVLHLRAVRGNGKSDRESFYDAAIWLYENHPETLLANLPLVPSFGCFKDLLELVAMVVEGKDATELRRKVQEDRKVRMADKVGLKRKWKKQWGKKKMRLRLHKRLHPLMTGVEKARINLEKLKIESQEAAVLRQEKRATHAARVLVKYAQCPRFRALHDAVGSIFAEALRKDLVALKEYNDRSTGGMKDGEVREVDESRERRRKWNGKRGPRMSLAAKWAPCLDRSYDRHTLMAESIGRRLFPRGAWGEGAGLTETRYAFAVREKYRKEVLAPLRCMMELPEVYMSANRWGELPYGRVASVCMKNNSKKFEAKDGKRFAEYLEDVKGGKAKIAAGALLPHQILKAAGDDDESGALGGQVAELQWRSMVEEMRRAGSLANGIAVCDVSGSMDGLPMDVAVALSLLIAELSGEPWNGHIITFSSKPQIHRVEGATLVERANFTKRMEWGYNTDFQAVFDGILERARNCQLAPQDMVRRLYVFSDMEFDAARGRDSAWATDHENIVRKFKEAGYEVPEIVFWNLSQWESNSTPVTADEPGTALVSGFSKNMMKVFMKGGSITPMEVMLSSIEGREYSAVKVVD